MSYKRVLLLLFIIFFSATLSKAQEFEGVIYYEIPEMMQQGVEELPYMVKDSKVRMDFGGPENKAAMLFMPEESKAIIIIDKMKGYMIMDFKDDAIYQSQDEMEMDLTNTGQIKTIAGVTCEVWSMKSTDGNFETCLSKELGAFMMPKSASFRENSPAWAKEISKDGFMPLEVYAITENGEKDLILRAVRIEEKKLPASLFEIPEGYRDMSHIMQGMMDKYQN